MASYAKNLKVQSFQRAKFLYGTKHCLFMQLFSCTYSPTPFSLFLCCKLSEINLKESIRHVLATTRLILITIMHIKQLFVDSIFMTDSCSLGTWHTPLQSCCITLNRSNNVITSLVANRKAMQERKNEARVGLGFITPSSFSSIAATVGLFLTVTLEGTGKCSTSSFDFPSLALFFLKTSFVGRGWMASHWQWC